VRTVVDAALGDGAGGELGAQVAEDAAGEADVALDHAEQRGVGLAAFVEFQRRDAQALGEDFRAVRGVGAGHAAADIGVMADRGGIGDRRVLLGGEDRLEDEDVGQVHAAVVGVVQRQHVARGDVAGEMAQGRLQCHRNAAQMAGQAEALRHQTALGVTDRGAVVHDVLEHPGIGGAVDRQGHLVADGGDRVAEQFGGDRIGLRHRGRLGCGGIGL
jgi:hypothetical protein